MKMNYRRALVEDGSSSSSFITPTNLLSRSVLIYQEENMRNLFQTESGMAFPYSEMVTEWNGARVHISEYEPKQPQLEPKPTGHRCTRFTICKTG
jgi:hypothetical protein